MVSRNDNVDDDFFGTPLSSAMNMPFNLEVGDIVLGRVSHIDNEFVYVSTGFKSEGRIPRSEFSKDPEAEIPYKVDDEIEVMIDRIGAEEIYVSYSKVAEQRRWDDLIKKHETQEPIDASVMKAVKGGYRVDVGLSRHAFMPASHAGDSATPEELEGKDVKVVLIEINRETGNIIVSQRELLKKENAEREDELFGKLQPGDIVSGKVTRLTNFGAFVDVGGAEGLIHISELAWTRVAHPSNVLSCGDMVEVKVLDADSDKKKISLSLKQAQGDPWETVEERFTPDEIVDGTVMRIVNYGAFVKVGEVFEGLLHNSELSASGEPQRKLAPGEELKVRVINVDSKGRRIKLGLPQQAQPVPVDAQPSAGGETVAAPAQEKEAEIDRYIDDGKSGVKLGDVLDGALDGSTNNE